MEKPCSYCKRQKSTQQPTSYYTDQQKQHIVDIYVACSRYELAFWEMAWRMSK